MKALFFIATCLFVNVSFSQADSYLAAIPKYNESSDFEDNRYEKMTWQQFYRLDEINEPVDPMNYDSDLMNAALFFAINKYRSTLGLSLLSFEPRLRDAAMIHSDQMVKRNFFDHQNPYDAKIRMPNNRAELCGFNGEHLAENLARMFVDMQNLPTYTQLADKVISALSKSKDHDKHMRDPKYDRLGTGFIFENKPTSGVYYFRTSQNFGKNW